MKKILVIGDSCVDINYTLKKQDRKELGFPIYKIINSTTSEGMAVNVYNNLKALTKNVELVTNKEVILKEKYFGDTVFRVDTEESVDRINLKNIRLEDYDIVVISDYDKGFLTKKDVKHVCENHDFVVIDTKKKIGTWCLGAKYIKINYYEFSLLDKSIEEELFDKLIITLGSRGCIYQNNHYPTEIVNAVDVTGAGDTFLAALAYSLTKTKISKALKFANKHAKEAVKVKGVYVIK